MARVISLALMLATVKSAHTEPFGRFGFDPVPEIPAFKVSAEGFQVKHAQADRWTWAGSSKVWTPVGISDLSATILLSGLGDVPLKIRVDLTAPGFLIYVQRGLRLHLTSLKSPFLSWSEGSVGPGVATPANSWGLVSFRDTQPPVMFGFLGAPTELEITGRAGDWTLRTPKAYSGWIRICAPTGTQARSTNGAAALGELTQEIAPFSNVWSAPSPQLLSMDPVSEPTAITATWTFDRPGFVVPRALTLANVAFYRAAIQSKVRRMPGFDELGPVEISESESLTARLPVGVIGPGLSVAVGSPKGEPIGSASAFDASSVVEVALSNLLACRDSLLQSVAKECAEEFFEKLVSTKEPNTRQLVPFDASGSQLDLAAAHGLLNQVRHSSLMVEDQPNGLLTSVLWSRDWLTWRLSAKDRDKGRRASALAAIASALSGTPKGRLDAAMLVAGLYFERGLGVWMSRKGIPPAKLLDALPNLIQAAFFIDGKPEPDALQAKSLFSSLRVFGPDSLHFSEEKGLQMDWLSSKNRADSFFFMGNIEDVIPVANVETVKMASVFEMKIIDVLAAAPGRSTIGLVPSGIALPQIAKWPEYREIKR